MTGGSTSVGTGGSSIDPTATSLADFVAASAVRLAGISEAVREAVPDAAVPIFEAATHLGDPALLTFALAVLYWAGRRHATATVIGYGFLGFAAVLALKSLFALPRPPESVWAISTYGYGFPSGHAVAGVVVYGGLAVEFDWLDHTRAVAGIGTLTAAIAFSRVVLGVHYLGDVLAGLVLGAAVVATARYLTGGDPARVFAVGAVAALPTVWITGAGTDALGILGACIGGLVAATRLDDVPERGSRVGVALLLLVGLPFVVVEHLLAVEDPLALAAVDDLVLVAGVVLLPAALERIDAVDRLPVGAGE